MNTRVSFLCTFCVHSVFLSRDIVTMSKEVQNTNFDSIPAPLPYKRKDNDDDDDDDGDPGLFFVVWPASKVHHAMALPSVAFLSPPLQQGKKNYN